MNELNYIDDTDNDTATPELDVFIRLFMNLY